jgi:hypothetical protein
MRLRSSRWPLVAAAALAAVLLVLVVAQLLLPSITAQRLRERLAADGNVQSVSVSAFPAVKLLWGHADEVHVRFASAEATSARIAELLGEDVDDLDVSIGSLRDGSLTLREVTIRKRGPALLGEARLSERALSRALPLGVRAQPVASGGGQLLMRAEAGLFGFGFAVDLLLSAQSGALVLEPVNVPFGDLAQVTVFSDPHMQMRAVGARGVAGGYLLSAEGRLSD